MCGIAGIIDFGSNTIDSELIKVMTSEMIERGPDDDGYFVDEHCALGFRRLSIIDVAGGHQPIKNEDGTMHLVFNGEIYNHIELREQLIRRGHRFRTNSDAEVILHLYEDFGVDALREVNGMFAFAIYSSARKQVFIARDRLGIKPLLYLEETDRFIFASDARALRRVVPLSVSREIAVDYLFNAYVPEPFSIWSGVKKLPAAHFMLIDGNGVTTMQKYWQPHVNGQWEGPIKEAVTRLDELLEDATALQMRSDVPVGIFLSGGVDSSAIVSYAASVSGEPLRTYSADFHGKHSADASYASRIAKRYGTNHVELSLGLEDMLASMDDMLRRFDEPVSDSAVFAVYAISQQAKRSGVRVLLSGAGGDEIFGGYMRYWTPRAFSPRWLSETAPPQISKPFSALLRLFQRSRGWAASDPALSWAQSVSGIDYGVLHSILRLPTDFMSGLHTLRTGYSIPRFNSKKDLIYPLMLHDLNTYLIGNVLALTDKASMAASVECRVPLLDHRLVEFAFSLPEKINMLGGVPKGLFKEMLSKRLPVDLLGRVKEGFNAPVAVWFNSASTIIRDELLGTTSPILEDIVNRPKLESLLRKGGLSNHGKETIFSLFMMNRWFRMQGAS